MVNDLGLDRDSTLDEMIVAIRRNNMVIDGMAKFISKALNNINFEVQLKQGDNDKDCIIAYFKNKVKKGE